MRNRTEAERLRELFAGPGATSLSSREAALQAQLRHVHALGDFRSLQSLLFWQRRIDPPEKAIEEALTCGSEIGVVGTVVGDQGQAANPAAELTLSLAHA